MIAAIFSDPGGVRKDNEDALYCGEVYCGCSMEGTAKIELLGLSFIVAVADGMGGVAGGTEAAELILGHLKLLDDSTPIGLAARTSIKTAVAVTLDNFKDLAAENPDLREMGTTLAGIWVSGDKALVFNCGDSRVYRVHRGFFELLTQDHSLVFQLYLCGEIAEEGMSSHPLKHILTSSIQESHPAPVINFKELNIAPGDSFFLCTDGVWEALSHSELSRFATLPFQEGADELSRCLLSKCCKDNISFVWIY
ncbi:MAG: serine/threonine-protein phosphatase [Deltaproteobacteria bacterium]|jgi:protein phosphatase|nr:serine/threonine-protein phosphatase [Deltaproteobacteria bacterium]